MLKKKIKKFLGFLFRFLPIKSNKIVASNFHGKKFGDNPGAIVAELLKSHEDLDIVWVLDDVNYDSDLPGGVRRVKEGSVRQLFEMATAKVWIDNVRKYFYPKKRKGQFYIQTWHGSIGMKMVEADAPNLPKEYIKDAKMDSKNADLFISGSKFLSGLYRKSFWYNGKIVEVGTPRLDKLITRGSDKEYVEKLRHKVLNYIGIKDNPKLKMVLYAPTFRRSKIKHNIDFERLRASLKKRFGGEWIVLLRLHPNEANKNRLENDAIKGVYDCTGYPDLYELLPLADVVISDYSSLAFEAAMINKIIFLYAPDYHEYVNNDRGLYFDPKKDLPFPFSENNNDLEKDILNYKMKNNSSEMSKKFGINETGKSAKYIAELILREIR